MRIKLSENFTYKKLLRFVLPPVVMTVFTQIYSIVDGLFISNFVGKSAFTAINLMMPFFIIIGSVGFMFGTGGSALVAKIMGEGNRDKANRIFSLMISSIILTGLLFTLIGEIFLPQIANLLGADEETYEYCLIYGRIVLAALTFFMLLNIFQSFFVVAEKARLGLIVTVVSGMLNIILDVLFVAVFKWGIIGAAAATAASQLFGGIFPIFYFLFKNNSLLRLTKPLFSIKAIFKACANGSSEFLSNISASVITLLYNFQLIKLVGNDGVAAYGAIMYISMIFIAIFFGYSIGVSPIISYHFGAKNTAELNNLLKKSLVIIAVCGFLMTAFSEALAVPLTKIFVGYDKNLYAMTLRGLKIYVLSFLICGFNMFSSSFFTALNNGLVSAAISFIRTVVLQIAAVMILPIFLKLDGVWLAVIVTESISLLVSLIFLLCYRKKYGYRLFKKKIKIPNQSIYKRF